MCSRELEGANSAPLSDDVEIALAFLMGTRGK